MGIIQDERERMIAHTKSAENMCDECCTKCYEEKRAYGELIGTVNTLEGVCPVGLSLSQRIIYYSITNQTDYSSNVIVPNALRLQEVSLKSANPKIIKDSIKTVRACLDNYEVKSEPEMNENKALSIEIPISRVSDKTVRRFSKFGLL